MAEEQPPSRDVLFATLVENFEKSDDDGDALSSREALAALLQQAGYDGNDEGDATPDGQEASWSEFVKWVHQEAPPSRRHTANPTGHRSSASAGPWVAGREKGFEEEQGVGEDSPLSRRHTANPAGYSSTSTFGRSPAARAVVGKGMGEGSAGTGAESGVARKSSRAARGGGLETVLEAAAEEPSRGTLEYKAAAAVNGTAVQEGKAAAAVNGPAAREEKAAAAVSGPAATDEKAREPPPIDDGQLQYAVPADTACYDEDEDALLFELMNSFDIADPSHASPAPKEFPKDGWAHHSAVHTLDVAVTAPKPASGCLLSVPRQGGHARDTTNSELWQDRTALMASGRTSRLSLERSSQRRRILSEMSLDEQQEGD